MPPTTGVQISIKSLSIRIPQSVLNCQASASDPAPHRVRSRVRSRKSPPSLQRSGAPTTHPALVSLAELPVLCLAWLRVLEAKPDMSGIRNSGADSPIVQHSWRHLCTNLARMTTRHRHPLVSYQPLKLLFQISYASLVFLRLPYYVTLSLIPSLRPNKKWNAKQTFMTRIIYPLLDSIARIGITETLTLDPGKEGRRFQMVPVSTSDAYKGPLESETVKPAKIGGTWFPDVPGADVTSKTVVLYFHGGAFVQGDGRTATCGSIAKYFLEKGSADAVFSLQYRLSGHGGLNPFPAALQDALSSYLFLLNTLHIPPHQIIFAGDSAGATLATSLLRYLHEFGSLINTNTPRCAVLLSPWVEPFLYDASDNPHRGTDFIPITFGRKYSFHPITRNLCAHGFWKATVSNPYH